MRIVTRYFSVKRGGTANTLSNLWANLYPSSADIVATFDIPGGKAFSVIFDGSSDIHEQDLLTDEADPTKTYLVSWPFTPSGPIRGTSRNRVPRSCCG